LARDLIGLRIGAPDLAQGCRRPAADRHAADRWWRSGRSARARIESRVSATGAQTTPAPAW